MPEEKTCDDATLERMKHYFKQHDHEELIRYIRRYGLRRHIDIFEENSST